MSELPSYVFHGTTSNYLSSLRSGIDVGQGRTHTDFWTGFYVTSDPLQAFKWAQSKRDYHNRRERDREQRIKRYTATFVTASVLVYKVDVQGLSALQGRTFEGPDAFWGGFVYNNRTGCRESRHWTRSGELVFTEHNLDLTYDFVYGPLADGSMEDAFFDLRMGRITFETFVACLRPKGLLRDQLSLHSPQAAQFLIPIGEVKTHEQAKQAARRYVENR